MAQLYKPLLAIHWVPSGETATRVMHELLIAHKAYLPQFADTIARLEKEGITIKDEVVRKM